jgi:uncharacterized surface protein with fasciclin (FAS1) repeats
MRLPALITSVLIAGSPLACAPKAPVIDRSNLANNGVDIVPQEVLAASRSNPVVMPPPTEDQADLIQTIQDSQQKHYYLIEVIRESGLMRTLQQTGDYTILAPTDEAFAKLPPGRLDWLLLPQNRNRLIQFVQYHIIKGRISQQQLLDTNGTVISYSGLPLTIRGVDHKVVINDANVIKSNTTAFNGNIIWIDNILDPDLARLSQ